MLMLNRAFFSLQSPWTPTWIALGNLALNAALFAVFYRVGTWGVPFAISLANIAGTGALLVVLRKRLGGIHFRETARSAALVILASAPAAGIAFGVWDILDRALGRALAAQLVSVGAALAAAVAAYLLFARLLGIRELAALLSLRARLRRA